MQKFRDMYWGLSKSAPPRVTSDVHSGAFRMVPQAAPSFHCLCSYTRRVVVGLLGVHAAFNPTKFNPEAWASSAKAAGMKYFVMCVPIAERVRMRPRLHNERYYAAYCGTSDI